MVTEYLYDEIEEILHSSLKERSVQFLSNFAKAIFKLSDQVDTTHFHPYILSQYMHFLNRR